MNGINHKDGTISWTITANQPAASLANAVITDKLDSKLNWQSAALEIYNGTSWDAGSASFSNEPADGKYEIGTINAKVRLTITAQLKDKSEIEHTVVSVNNKQHSAGKGIQELAAILSTAASDSIRSPRRKEPMMRLHIRRPGM